MKISLNNYKEINYTIKQIDFDDKKTGWAINRRQIECIPNKNRE
jgi:hypothetical protein